MKKGAGVLLLLSLLFLFSLRASVFANPPAEVRLTWEEERRSLGVEVLHPTEDVLNHYIERIDLSVNGTVLESRIYTRQQDPAGTTAWIVVTDLPPDAILDVRVYCNREGFAEASLLAAESGKYGYVSPQSWYPETLYPEYWLPDYWYWAVGYWGFFSWDPWYDDHWRRVQRHRHHGWPGCHPVPGHPDWHKEPGAPLGPGKPGPFHPVKPGEKPPPAPGSPGIPKGPPIPWTPVQPGPGAPGGPVTPPPPPPPPPGPVKPGGSPPSGPGYPFWPGGPGFPGIHGTPGHPPVVFPGKPGKP